MYAINPWNTNEIAWRGDPRLDPSKRDETSLQSKIDSLSKALADATAKQQARVDAWGEEPEEGTVLRVRYQFAKGGQRYTYALLRAGGKWWRTGQHNSGVSWDTICEWLEQAHKAKVTPLIKG